MAVPAKNYSQHIFWPCSTITLKIQQMIPYDRYTELLSKMIYKTITPAESKVVAEYEAAQPQSCPKCGAGVMTFLTPYRVAHDVEKWGGKEIAKS